MSANTHDLPPLAAFESGSDLELRRRAGQIPDDAALAAERARRARDLQALRRRLVRDRCRRDEKKRAGAAPEPLAPAVTRFLCATPSPLVALSLDDLVGEDEPVNLPGVGPERHASWSRRMAIPLRELPEHALARATLQAVPAARRPRRTRPRARS